MKKQLKIIAVIMLMPLAIPTVILGAIFWGLVWILDRLLKIVGN